MASYRVERGDTVRNVYRDEIYPDLELWPEVEQQKLYELWRDANRQDPNKIRSGEVYSFVTSPYGEGLKIDREQSGLRGNLPKRFTVNDMLRVNSALSAFRKSQQNRVRGVDILAGGPGNFTLPASTLTAASMKSYMGLQNDEVEAGIIEMMNNDPRIDTIKKFKKWYKDQEFDPLYYTAVETAFKGQQEAIRAGAKFPGEMKIQEQTIARGERRVIIREGMKVPQVQNDDGTWVDDPTQPEYPRSESGMATYSDANGRRRYAEGPNVGMLVSEVAGLPTVQKEYQPREPRISEDKNGRKRYVSTGKLVFKGLEVDPETKADVNGRLRYASGANKGALVFSEDGGPVPKEYAPQARGIKEFKVGDELHTYAWDAEKKKWVPFKVGGVAVVSSRFEGKSQEMSAKHRNWKHWVGLKNESLVEQGKKPLSTGEMEKSYQEMVLKHQVVESAAEPGEGKALAEKQVAFADSTTLVQRMLRQLEDPKTFIGLGRSVLSGFDAITGQYRMFANAIGEGHLLDEELYDFGAAAKSAALKSNILGMGYALARSQEGKGGRLSESDVRNAIERITGSLQSKATMAASLIEVYNTILRNAKHTYTLARDRGVRGAEAEWGEYLKPLNTGEMKSYSRPGFRGIGYKTFVIKNGEKIEMLQSIAEWPVED